MKRISNISKLMLVTAMILPVSGQMKAGFFGKAYSFYTGCKESVSELYNECRDVAESAVETAKAVGSYVKPTLYGVGTGFVAAVAHSAKNRSLPGRAKLVTFAFLGGAAGAGYKKLTQDKPDEY